MISIDRKKQIENMTIETLQNVEMLDKIPVDIMKIAKNLGINVFECNFGKQGISGAIIKKNDEYRIYVKNDDAVVRKRFTIAHELGHFILHKDKLDDAHYDDIMYRGNLSSQEEEESNYFAGCILINKNNLLDIYRVTSDRRAIAKIFEVSEAALNIRFEELKDANGTI